MLIKKCFWEEEQALGIIAVDWSRYGAWPPVGEGRNTKATLFLLLSRNLVPKCCLFLPNDKRTS